MFKKPFKIKSSSPLKGKEIRKFKLDLIKYFPTLTEEGLASFIPNKETVCSVKVAVHSGLIVQLYCIQKLPIIFKVSEELYPTVYMLWHFPELLPVFSTHPEVFSSISSGADLMLPGVVLPETVNIKSYGKLNKGDPVSVNLTNNKAPIAVGMAALSSFDMYMSAKRGKCVNILHFFGDTLSNYGSTMTIPQLGAVTFGKTCEDTASAENEILQELVGELTVNENLNDCNPSNNIVNCVELNSEPTANLNELKEEMDNNDVCDNTEDMNELLMYCFLKSLKTNLKKDSLPLLVSKFFKLYVLAACPSGKNLDVRKTKYKKFSSFLNEVADLGVIKLEVLSKGIEHIYSVSFDHYLFKDFKKKYSALEQLAAASTISDPQLSDTPVRPVVKEKRTVTAQVLPLFSLYLNKKGDSLTLEIIRKCITDYVKTNNLKDKENEKLVKLDVLLKNIVGGGAESIPWDKLISSIVDKMGHAYELISEQERTVCKGKLSPILIQTFIRRGDKKVTVVSNLELYGINVSEFAQECQHGVGAGTSTKNCLNQKSTQVIVQGNQVLFVSKLLQEKYRIYKSHINMPEVSSKKKNTPEGNSKKKK